MIKILLAVLSFIRRKIQARNNPMETVAGAAFVIAVFGVASRLLGLIRDRILASQFGAGDVLDVYYAAFRIPDLLYSLLALGALSAAFIPMFTEMLERSTEKRAWELASSVLTLLVVTMILLSLVGIVALPWIVPFIAPGFGPDKQQMVVDFARIMFLSPLFLGASAVLGGVLVSKRCFWAYSVAPLFYNAGIIVGATIGVQVGGVQGLAWGVALGAILHFTAQMISARKIGFVFILEKSFSFWQDASVRKVITLMIPRTLTVAANQINLFVITIFASTLTAGSLAVFNFANNLQSIPLALFGISFATAVFPRLSTLSAKRDYDGFSHTFYRTLKRILFFVVPITVLMLVLRAQIVRVVLGAGHFDWEDTVLTFGVLGILALSLFAQSLIPLLARSFYSLQNTKTPFFIALFSEGMNILLVIFLIQKFAVYGLAIAFTVSAIVQMCLMVLFLRRWVRFPSRDAVWQFILKLVVASLSAGVVAQGMKSFWGTVTNLSTFWEVFAQLVFSGVAGIGVFVLMAKYLHIEEYEDFRKNIAKKVFNS